MSRIYHSYSSLHFQRLLAWSHQVLTRSLFAVLLWKLKSILRLRQAAVFWFPFTKYNFQNLASHINTNDNYFYCLFFAFSYTRRLTVTPGLIIISWISIVSSILDRPPSFASWQIFTIHINICFQILGSILTIT